MRNIKLPVTHFSGYMPIIKQCMTVQEMYAITSA